MPIESVERSQWTLAFRVEELLRREITSGQRPSGSRLNESEIAAAFEVSRGPVREALQRLARDGIVVLQAHRGAFVKRFDPDEVRELFEIRAALESEAAALAALRITDAGIEELREMHDQTVHAVSDREDHAFPELFDLHELITELANNNRLTGLIKQVNAELRLVRSRSGASPRRAQEAIDEHDSVISCLTNRDAEGAAQNMRTHLQAALTNTLEIMYQTAPN